MPNDRPIVHLVCNAHLDPVWMWPWEEGLRESISTFWTAINLLDEFPEFVFNHNESLLYEWVEDHDPLLFARIREYVEAGRWNVTGGWYLQPDVNLPGGETLARVILEGRRYFAETFGIEPPVAYNFDSFGHPGSLPGLLKNSGFDYYIHCRPTASQMELPAALYRWRGVDGSEVMTLRPDTGWYGTPRPGQAQEQALNGIEQVKRTGRDALVSWGLGDHGGGPTRRDLVDFREMLDDLRDGPVELRHSTPEAYFKRMERYWDELPVVEGELQRTLSGTYTSVARIKRQMREIENLMLTAEKWSAAAWWRFGRDYPAAKLREAWKRLLFNTFHDVLCGSLVEGAMPGVDAMYGFAGDVARRVIAKSQYAMLPNKPPRPHSIPLYVLNPHSTQMQSAIGENVLIAYAPQRTTPDFAVYDDAGQPVPHQTNGGASFVLEEEGRWQPFVGFVADVPPMSARRYEIRFDHPHGKPANQITVTENEEGITVENNWWRARFDHATAALHDLVDKDSGRNLLAGAMQLFAMDDVGHAWGGENRFVYNEPVSVLAALTPEQVGDFTGVEGQTGPALRVVAQGDVWVTVEGLVGWQHTRASIRITLYADMPHIDIQTRLYMQARRKMMKLVFPFNLPGTRALCEVPYGIAERPADSTEYPYARWVRLDSPGVSVGVANSGQSGFDVGSDGTLRLSLSRGGVHCSWEGDPGSNPPDTKRSYTYMDQEQIDTNFRLVAGTRITDVADALTLAALELNQPLQHFFAYYPATSPDSAPAEPLPFLTVDPPAVILGALKQAESGEGLVVRLVETSGQPVTARVQLETEPEQTIEFGPYEVKTFIVQRDGESVVWLPCRLDEVAVE